ncbi:hypothetical protein [Pseudolactococcus chungangensis]|nr:hypothetical protein [Lactococcus chungangensis]
MKIDVFLDQKESTQIDISRKLVFHAGRLAQKTLVKDVGVGLT